MLTYAADDFIEVADSDIEVLQRSRKCLDIEGPGGVAFEVQAYLCLHGDDDGHLCHLAFYCRTLKRSIVFAVIGPESRSELLEQAEVCLSGLGFEMETVKLNFGSAMLQVVLRDIPCLQSVEYVDEFRSARADLLSRLEQASGLPAEDEGDVAGEELAARRGRAETAALRLATERRIEKQLQTLREELERVFSPEDTTPGPDAEDRAGRLEQMSEAIRKLEADLDEERARREFTEQIKAAAEKRIQELEETLVGYEAKAAGSIKKSQKSAQLAKRISELNKELTEAIACADVERELREQVERVAEEVGQQNERLAAELAEADEKTTDLLAKNEVLTRNLEVAREGLSVQQKRLEDSEKSLAEALVAVRGADESSQRLEKLHLELEAANARCDLEVSAGVVLKVELEEVRQTIVSLEDALREAARAAEKVASEGAVGQVVELEDLKTDLAAALVSAAEATSARDDLLRELDESQLRIQTLEKRLEKAEGKQAAEIDVGAQKEAARLSVELQAQLEGLRKDLGQAEAEKQQAEKDLTRAVVRIEILEEELEKSRQRVHVQTVVQPVAAESPAVQVAAVEGLPDESAKKADLPHVVRRPPAKGAFFHVNWDQQALSGQSADKILEAWKSVYNVQLTLEGYPSQYCSGALIVLKEGKGKQLFMMFYLKKSERMLVYEPARKPKDAKGFKAALEEARKFMMLSGIEFDKVGKVDLGSALTPYLQKD